MSSHYHKIGNNFNNVLDLDPFAGIEVADSFYCCTIEYTTDTEEFGSTSFHTYSSKLKISVGQDVFKIKCSLYPPSTNSSYSDIPIYSVHLRIDQLALLNIALKLLGKGP